jgi:isopenicillin-N N-acyltransferase-like protein
MWRLILECSSVAEAVAAIQAYGCASSCHMLIADPCGNASVEVTHCTIEFIKPDARGRIFHSNHMLLPHPGTSPMAMNESRLRVERIREVADELQGEITKESIQSLLCDEKNFPCSINRAQEGESDAESVFSIVTDATNAEARVLLGRPSKPERIFMLQPRLMK